MADNPADPAELAGRGSTASSGLPRQWARTRRFTLGAPRSFTIAADGSRVLFLRSRAGDDPVTCLWSLEVASGTEEMTASITEIARNAADATAVGIEAVRVRQAIRGKRCQWRNR